MTMLLSALSQNKYRVSLTQAVIDSVFPNIAG